MGIRQNPGYGGKVEEWNVFWSCIRRCMVICTVWHIIIWETERTLKTQYRIRCREIPAEEPDLAQEAGGTDPAMQTEILELLGTLSGEERLIVVMTVFGGYKGEEIARILHRKHSTVRTKYRRALKKLGQELEREESGRP